MTKTTRTTVKTVTKIIIKDGVETTVTETTTTNEVERDAGFTPEDEEHFKDLEKQMESLDSIMERFSLFKRKR